MDSLMRETTEWLADPVPQTAYALLQRWRDAALSAQPAESEKKTERDAK
jgi:hypothetical protein